MSRRIYIKIKYKDKVYTFYKGKPGDWDIPVKCSDGRMIPPYEREIADVVSLGEVILKK